MRRLHALAAAFPMTATSAAALAQPAAVSPDSAETAAPPVDVETPPAWEFSLSVIVNAGPDKTYAQPTVTADCDWLHLEARYNYEAPETTSLWIGCNFSAGKEITLDFTPMLGAVMGKANGIAPGYELTVIWWKLGLYTEGEYVFNTQTSQDNFFYSWSQLTVSVTDRFYVGLAAQRTRVYDSAREIDVGPIAGLIYKDFNVSAWMLNPDNDHPIFGVSLDWTF